MSIQLVFETHSLTEDNAAGRATGWLPGRLSEEGRVEAKALGQRRKFDRVAAVFTSDLARAVETATIAFGDTKIPIHHDWRLRECDYGDQNGMVVDTLHAERRNHLDVPYPNGESWRQAIERVRRGLADLPTRWDGKRIVVIGHVATRWALDHYLGGRPLEALVDEDFNWQRGWIYELSAARL